MSKEVARAAWNSTYEKGLVDVLHDYKDNPKLKGQNGWNSEGWKCITAKFNERFSLAHFTKQQLQEKEKELKSSYKAVRDSRKESGTGWNDSLCMILAEPEVWARLISAHPKVARFRKKPFPLFYSLEALYEGSVATGQLNFTSTQQLPPAIIPPLAPPAIVPPAPSFVVPSARSTSEQTLHPFNTNPFDLDGQEMTSEAQSVSAIHEAREGEGSKSRKRKQSHVGAALEDYVEFKKSQTNKALDALKELSMRKCMEEIEAIGGFTEEEKSYAVEVFESGINREAFMSTMNHNVQRMWLKRKIRKCVEILM